MNERRDELGLATSDERTAPVPDHASAPQRDRAPEHASDPGPTTIPAPSTSPASLRPDDADSAPSVSTAPRSGAVVEKTTKVGVHTVRRARLLLGIPLVGALAGAVVALGIELIAELTGFDGIVGRADHLGEPVGLLVGAVVGLALGAIVAGGALREAMRAEVSNRAIGIHWDDAHVTVPRALVSRIVLADDLVVHGRGGVELARVPNRLNTPVLLGALAEFDYPEPVSVDPHADDFRPWTADDDLEDGNRRLLLARAAAVRNGQHGDAELLRRQLARRGVMVRDRQGRPAQQQWRRVVVRTIAPLTS
jgi:hypothetical protein